LARLLNAALVDPTFGESFLAAPALAARRAIDYSGETFGTTLPDPALCLTLPPLGEREWHVLGRLPRAETLAMAARELRRLSLPGTTLPRAVQIELADLTVPASHEGAYAGAA